MPISSQDDGNKERKNLNWRVGNFGRKYQIITEKHLLMGLKTV
jgi:hypothetical protein